MRIRKSPQPRAMDFTRRIIVERNPMNINSLGMETRSLSFICVALMLPLATLAASDSDNFDDNVKDASKWGTDVTSGSGVLTERNHRIEYTSGTLLESDSNRPWIATHFPFDADWEVQVDVFDVAFASIFGQVNSAGILIETPDREDTDLYMELYSSGFAGASNNANGFHAEMQVNNVHVASADSGVGDSTNAAVRIRWDSATRVMHLYYDAVVSDGSRDWVELGSYGLAGSGGSIDNGDWNLSATNQFVAYIYGYSVAMRINSGQMYLDNFMETGGVASNGREPTGHFRFRFPTNNPLLTKIFDLTGHYTGVTPTLLSNDHARAYSSDVAQDESGKLMSMGTMEGITNASGGPELSGIVGSVSTVNNKPTVAVKGSFTGTGDGVPATAKANAIAPVEFADIGGGTNAAAATVNVAAKVAGIPFRLKQTPIMVPVNETFQNNVKQDWSFDLDLSSRIIKGKQRTVASAQLLLPNGDTISYAGKVARYSATKGYSLSFKRGTNITANPMRIDKKSSLSIRGLKFVAQGNSWQPTQGTVIYQFLGQKGTANLTDFLSP
jgi:hypothetical protein